MHIFRKHSKAIIVTTAALFVGGMALMGFSGMFTGSKSELGRIGGKKVSVQEFSQKLKEVIYNYQKSLGDVQLSKEQLAEVNNQVWRQMVQDYIIEQAIDDYDVEVSAKQVAKAIKEQPLPQIKQMKEFQTDGQFDNQKYLQALRLGRLNVEALESVYRQRLLIENLQLKVVGDVFVSDEDVRQEYIDQNQMLSGKLIWFNPANIKQEQEVSLQEMQKFYQENKQVFQKGESRVFDYVEVKFDGEKSKLKAEKKLQKLLTLSAAKGFEQAAKELKLTIEQSEDVLKARANFPVVGANADLFDQMFTKAAVGDCSQIAKGEQSLVVFCLKSIDISPFFSFEKVKDKLSKVLQFQAKASKSVQEGKKFFAGKKNYLTRARRKKLEILNLKNIKVNDPLPELGAFPALSEALFSLDEGEYTDLIVDTLMSRGAFIGKVQKRSKLDWKDFAQKKESLKEDLKSQKNIREFNMWFSKQVRLLKVKDYRYKFFDYIPKRESV